MKLLDYLIFENILLGMVLALALGWLAIRLARRIGLMDMPGSLPHKKHGAPVPLAGGLTFVLALAIGGLIFNFEMVRSLWTIFVPALVVFAVGVWDDFKRLPARIKFAGQLVAAVLMIALGTHVRILQPGFLGLDASLLIWGNWFITLFWIVGITNAMNLIDSMDGLVVGVAGISVAAMMLVTVGSQQLELQKLLTLMLGICFGLYFYNMSPPRFFLGDSGAQTFGFLLAAAAILFTPGERPQASSWFVPILILGVPIFDTTLVFFSRTLRGKPFYSAERNHTYHRLVDMGLDNNRAVLVMHLASILLACVAFIALQLEPVYANAVFAAMLVLGVITIYLMDRNSK